MILDAIAQVKDQKSKKIPLKEKALINNPYQFSVHSGHFDAGQGVFICNHTAYLVHDFFRGYFIT